MVPLNPGRLLAALEAKGLSVAELAGVTGEKPQTLAHLLKHSRRNACRLERRRKLAVALDVSEEFLAGQPLKLDALLYLPFPDELFGSARLTLAVGGLFEKVISACQRDLDRAPAPPDGNDGLSPDSEVLHFVILALAHLVSARSWQGHIIQQRPSKRKGYAWPPPNPWDPNLWSPIDPDDEVVTLAFCRALAGTLTPWLEDKANLNYQHLWELAAAQRPSVRHWRSAADTSEIPDDPTNPYVVLRHSIPPDES